MVAFFIDDNDAMIRPQLAAQFMGSDQAADTAP